MKLFLKILFWVYFTLATTAFVLVIIYLVSHYRPFVKKSKYEFQERVFNSHFRYFNKPDTTFSSLFDINSEIAVDYLNKSESYLKDFKFKAQAIQISKLDISKLDSLISKWPSKFQEITKYNLLAIFVVDSARFNGLTQIINQSDNRFIIFLNSRLFHTPPNEWIKLQSTKCLKEEFKHHIKCRLFTEEQNTPIRTVEHVLLHEYAHIFSFINNEAPLPDGWFNSKKGYFPLIETCFDGGYVDYESKKEGLDGLELLSHDEDSNSEKLDIAKFKKLNKGLISSQFPTGYSTKNSSELVAELLTYYIHQKYLHQSFFMTFDDIDTITFAQKIDTQYLRKLLD